MPNGKDKPPSYIDYRKLLVLLVFSLVLALIVGIKSPRISVTYQLNDIASSNIKAPADFSIPGTDITVKKGEIIVREGERISEEHLKKLDAVNALQSPPSFSARNFLAFFALMFLFVMVLFVYAEKNIKKFALSLKDLAFATLFTGFSALVTKACFMIFAYYVESLATELFYVIPILVFGIVLRIVLFSEAALIFSLILAVVLSFTFDNSLTIFLYALVGNVLAAYFSGKCENRSTILKAGFYAASLTALVVIMLSLFLGRSAEHVIVRIAFILLGGIISSFLALGILPLIENVFDYTTDIKLLELANLENPLLEDMMLNAPGTYHHSIVVGNLSNAASESIGAHPLLTRVAAYYHDIGKLKMPHYYIENRMGSEDAHEGLTPNMSALIILSHVKEGVDLAHEYKIGTKITDIIRQHHGTSLVSYFYSVAKEKEDPDLHVIEEKDFRYAGPKPQTKEAGIIMLADAVEAASRTLEDPTPKRIESHVQNVIENIFLDGQLDECELTLKDLHAIQKSFIAILIGIFHHRIDYPERTTNGGTDKKLPKASEIKHKDHQKGHRRFARLFGGSK